MTAEEAIHNFWSGFSIPAYDEFTVPDNATLPYITYSFGYDVFGGVIDINASIWYRSTSWAEITAKAQEIADKIKNGGINLKTDNGGIWLYAGSPIYQRYDSGDNDIRRIYLNIYGNDICR